MYEKHLKLNDFISILKVSWPPKWTIIDHSEPLKTSRNHDKYAKIDVLAIYEAIKEIH